MDVHTAARLLVPYVQHGVVAVGQYFVLARGTTAQQDEREQRRQGFNRGPTHGCLRDDG